MRRSSSAIRRSAGSSAGARASPKARYAPRSARGAVLGLTRGVNRNHVVRATLESLAYQTADVLDSMRKDAGIELNALRVDGGASANDFLMQFQSDIIGVTVVRPECVETTALGAAYLAGLATGFWGGLPELRSNAGGLRRFEPSIGADERARALALWHDAVARVRSGRA